MFFGAPAFPFSDYMVRARLPQPGALERVMCFGPGQWVSALRLLLETLGKFFFFSLGGRRMGPRADLLSLWKVEEPKGKQSSEMDMDFHN